MDYESIPCAACGEPYEEHVYLDLSKSTTSQRVDRTSALVCPMQLEGLDEYEPEEHRCHGVCDQCGGVMED